ncbi:hypothetical protein GCM10018785_14840 [Streptomyces longispororuber]|uniref:Uncharacterized protein n=1 Tax=Streptomyces longispororuber TaxID=68230 RepID=A0A919DHZ6_9ACTN|nr:hypothetical protein [Streptomyces longispororuber]GHE46139.1 hypothetical protein GCM10018785_14840 [Streptomyces longispororuber]
MTTRSAWHLPTGQTREDTRLAVSLGMAASGPLTARGGCVVGGLQLTGTAATSMQARLSPGRLWVPGGSAAAQGGYPVTVDADTQLTFADGHATLPRVDALVVRVYDADYDASGRYEAVLEIVQGTPASAPVPPALPRTAELLYEVSVPAGASAARGITWATSVADRRRYTAALGGILPAGGGHGTQGAYPGQYRDAGGRLERWDGGQWQKYIPDAVLRHSIDLGWTTSKTFTEALNEAVPLTTSFVAPASTWVHIAFGARVAGDDGGGAYLSVNVRPKAGGALLLTASDDLAAIYTGAGSASVYTNVPLGRLTPGTEYSVTAAHRTGTTKAWFDNRFLRVDPVA